MGEPVVHCRADPPAFDRRIARPVMTGDKQDDALAPVDCAFEGAVDRPPGVVEVEPVEIDDPIRVDRALTEPAVPPAIQRRPDPSPGRRSGWTSLARGRSSYLGWLDGP